MGTKDKAREVWSKAFSAYSPLLYRDWGKAVKVIEEALEKASTEASPDAAADSVAVAGTDSVEEASYTAVTVAVENAIRHITEKYDRVLGAYTFVVQQFLDSTVKAAPTEAQAQVVEEVRADLAEEHEKLIQERVSRAVISSIEVTRRNTFYEAADLMDQLWDEQVEHRPLTNHLRPGLDSAFCCAARKLRKLAEGEGISNA